MSYTLCIVEMLLYVKCEDYTAFGVELIPALRFSISSYLPLLAFNMEKKKYGSLGSNIAPTSRRSCDTIRLISLGHISSYVIGRSYHTLHFFTSSMVVGSE